MNPGLYILIATTIAGIYVGILTQRPVASFSDSAKCPFCYGNDSCKDVDDGSIILKYDSWRDLFYNIFSVKNVFFGEYEGRKVVLKKLGHTNELDGIRRRSFVTKEDVLDFLNGGNTEGVRNFKTCSPEVSKLFVERVREHFGLEQIWTVLQVNVEPLILDLFQDGGWPVPKLFGTCGFLVIEQNCGLSLTHYEHFSWEIRAHLAVQLLEAAVAFSSKHPDFRVYLTDISPDNVAVDENFTLYFIDLENVILTQKLEDNETIHHSEYFADEDFVYSEEEVCQSPISDHNVYTVCRLLLSRSAPWPMMPNGLLHSPPPRVAAGYRKIFSLVEECVESKKRRFSIAEELTTLLKQAIE